MQYEYTHAELKINRKWSNLSHLLREYEEENQRSGTLLFDACFYSNSRKLSRKVLSKS